MILLFEVKVLFEIGNIYRDYIVVYLFLVIWSMYSSYRMKTLIRIFKDYDKNISFMAAKCIVFEKERNPFDFIPSFFLTAC